MDPVDVEIRNKFQDYTFEQETQADTQHDELGSQLPESISWRVSNSWSLISGDRLEKVGVDCFLRMFDEHPELLALFRFGGESIAPNKQGIRDLPATLKHHALVVMQTIGQCASGLTKLEVLVPKLRAIGNVHESAGVQQHHYDILFRHLMEAIAAELGPTEFDGETRQAWELAFRSITRIIDRPKDVLQMEPLEGYGALNAAACMYFTFYAPFRMAGFTARNEIMEATFNILTTAASFVLVLDLGSHWIVDQLRRREFNDISKCGILRRNIYRFLFPVKFRVRRFVRGLGMQRWANWREMDFIVLMSFPLQYGTNLIFGREPRAAGVHWTYTLGLLRMAAGARVLHFVRCAENNLMLRRRVERSELMMIRVVKLLITMLAFIHFSACLWCIVARVELGPSTVEPKASSFFPNPDLLMGGTGVLNSYMHAIHWAWVNLAGIGECDSVPQSSLECFIILIIHFCGATLYTVMTGNVVAILEEITAEQNETSTDLADLGQYMHRCHVPEHAQRRIMQGYMMRQVTSGSSSEDKESFGSAPIAPAMVARLPAYLRQELNCYSRAEAIKNRDPAFGQCSNEFLFAIVGALKSKTVLLPGDYFVKESENIPQQVILVEQGTIEVIRDRKCVRLLQRGDIIGKRWLLSTGEVEESLSEKTSLRAETACTLVTGLGCIKSVRELSERYPKDFALLQFNRQRILEIRESSLKRRNSLELSISSLMIEES